MTTKAAFSPSEWQLLLEGPPTAGLLLTVANKVAAAHREGGKQVSPAEEQAIADITTALGMSS